MVVNDNVVVIFIVVVESNYERLLLLSDRSYDGHLLIKDTIC